MTLDPFGGRMPASSQQAPYQNALEVVPDDDRDLPVIPSAIYVPSVVSVRVPVPNPTAPDPIVDANGGFLNAPSGKEENYLNLYPWRVG